jgi:hypothetical protein
VHNTGPKIWQAKIEEENIKIVWSLIYLLKASLARLFSACFIVVAYFYRPILRIKFDIANDIDYRLQNFW